MVRHCPRSQPFLPVGANIATTRAMILFSRDHKCINPESRRGGRSESVPDLNINANARPGGGFKIPKGAEAYFTLDKNGNPQSDNFIFEDNNEVAEDAWEDKDYLKIN